MHIVLVTPHELRLRLLPFTYFSAPARLRLGVCTLEEKWRRRADSVSSLPLPGVRPFSVGPATVFAFVQAAVIPTDNFLARLAAMSPFTSLHNAAGDWLASTWRGDFPSRGTLEDIMARCPADTTPYQGPLRVVDRIWKIVQYNEEEILADTKDLAAEGNTRHPGDSFNNFFSYAETNCLYGEHPIHLGTGAQVQSSTISTQKGPVYIGKNAFIENSFLRGPCAVGDGTRVLGAKLSQSTLGPHTKVGGEVARSVIFGYSNKAHQGFLGDSVVGYWCNIGAGTNVSNLKNTHSPVSLWDYAHGGYVATGLQFCGLFMGDYSKCGVGTILNTGTVMGFSAHVFGHGFPPKHLPSFFWGGGGHQGEFSLEKALLVAERTMQRRNKTLSAEQKGIFRQVFEETAPYRNE